MVGQNRGLTGARSGLWSEFARCVDEFRPERVLVENVAVLRSRGLPAVLWDLHRHGYDAVWDCIPASAAGAPHLRDRIWIVAQRRDLPSQPFAGKRLGNLLRAALDKWKLPRAGRTRDGFLYAQPPRFPWKDSRALVEYPTPRASANEWRTLRDAPSHASGKHGATLPGRVNELERQAGRVPAPSSESAGNLNPEWVEWLMGLPGGWTDPTCDDGDLRPHWGWPHGEPTPRTIAQPQDRRRRLMALGNGLVPQVAQIALDTLRP